MKRILPITMILLLAICVGCKPSQVAITPENGGSGGNDSHAGHDHEETGAHGGHMLHLEPAGAHAEWTHDDDTHTITVYVDEFDAAKVVGLKFVAKIGDTVEEFPLSASDTGWSITSETLMTHINMGEAAKVTLVVTDDRGEQSAQVDAHEHHHH